MNSKNRLGASFRDPSGFLFTHDSLVYRQVNRAYQPQYDYLIDSGLYAALINDKRPLIKRISAAVAHKWANQLPDVSLGISMTVVVPRIAEMCAFFTHGRMSE